MEGVQFAKLVLQVGVLPLAPVKLLCIHTNSGRQRLKSITTPISLCTGKAERDSVGSGAHYWHETLGSMASALEHMQTKGMGEPSVTQYK